MDGSKTGQGGTGDFASGAPDVGSHFQGSAEGMAGYLALVCQNALNAGGNLTGDFSNPKGPVFLGG